jgi:alkylation response protein AidB-like acyl-CoA dehydrogenase
VEIQFTPEERLFRSQARQWLEEHVPRRPRPSNGPAMREFDLAWQREQYEAGWAGIAWPTEFGGRGLPLVQQLIWHEEYARAHAPQAGVCFVGLNHGGPTLMARGSQAQQAFHLPKILKGEVVWCQGFSEPNAGSDLASLRTSAVIDGDELVVNGSKIWTSYAQLADYQELLVRTDPGAPKHKGISWVICDMHSPGIEIRPIRTMAASDHFHFCEVFYSDVRIPLANVVGGLNDGWNVARATLGFERGTAFIADQIHYAEVVEQMVAQARTAESGRAAVAPFEAGDVFARLAFLRAEMAAVRAMTYMTISRSGHQTPGPEGSLVRLYFSEAQQRVRRLAMDILGPGNIELSSEEDGWSWQYLRSFAATIAGGTSDIQRNIIGERILGLPR